MEPWLFAVICSPFWFASTIVSVFFLYCLMRPTEGVTVRYPMRFLLTTVLCNSSLLQFATAVIIITVFVKPPLWLHAVSRAVIYQAFTSNFSCNAWISIFYHMAIVPHKHAIFIWIKRNITVIIYFGFISSQMLLLFSLFMGTIAFVQNESTLINSTINSNTSSSSTSTSVGLKIFQLSNFLFVLYCTCPLVILSISWGKTFFYLREHMKQMGQNESFSKSQQKSQMRVTVTGMIQAAVFIPSSFWCLAAAFLYIVNLFELVDPGKYITISFLVVSNLGNLLCFGVSQSVFRIRIVSLWKKTKEDS